MDAIGTQTFYVAHGHMDAIGSQTFYVTHGRHRELNILCETWASCIYCPFAAVVELQLRTRRLEPKWLRKMLCIYIYIYIYTSASGDLVLIFFVFLKCVAPLRPNTVRHQAKGSGTNPKQVPTYTHDGPPTRSLKEICPRGPDKSERQHGYTD